MTGTATITIPRVTSGTEKERKGKVRKSESKRDRGRRKKRHEMKMRSTFSRSVMISVFNALTVMKLESWRIARVRLLE